MVGSALLTMLTNALQDILPHLSSNGEQLQAIVFAILYVLALQFARGGVMPLVSEVSSASLKAADCRLSANLCRDGKCRSPERRCWWSIV